VRMRFIILSLLVLIAASMTWVVLALNQPRPAVTAEDYFRAALLPLYDAHEQLTLVLMGTLQDPGERPAAADAALTNAHDQLLLLSPPPGLEQVHDGLILASSAARDELRSSPWTPDAVVAARRRMGMMIQALTFVRGQEAGR
jgi:hypothetical protein